VLEVVLPYEQTPNLCFIRFALLTSIQMSLYIIPTSAYRYNRVHWKFCFRK